MMRTMVSSPKPPQEMDFDSFVELLKYLNKVIKIAKTAHGGHVTIFRFSSGWKVVFGTPMMWPEDRLLLEDPARVYVGKKSSQVCGETIAKEKNGILVKGGDDRWR